MLTSHDDSVYSTRVNVSKNEKTIGDFDSLKNIDSVHTDLIIITLYVPFTRV